MTDREHLQKAIEILERYYHDRTKEPHVNSFILDGVFHAISILRTHKESDSYKPSSRPCFDKPVGVPILHGETV